MQLLKTLKPLNFPDLSVKSPQIYESNWSIFQKNFVIG